MPITKRPTAPMVRIVLDNTVIKGIPVLERIVRAPAAVIITPALLSVVSFDKSETIPTTQTTTPAIRPNPLIREKACRRKRKTPPAVQLMAAMPIFDRIDLEGISSLFSISYINLL